MTAKETWKPVTIGGLTGILMGAGAMYGVQAFAQRDDDVTVVTPEEEMKVGTVSDNMSFAHAFEAARAEVGPGGVFTWHGNIYNTYTVKEWETLSDSEKQHFASRVKPEISPSNIDARQITEGSVNDEDVQIASHDSSENENSTITHSTGKEDSVSHEVRQIVDDFGIDDVRIVGYTNVEGHLTVGYDTNGDGRADVAIIDVDDSRNLSPQDIIIDEEGNLSTFGEMVNDESTGNIAHLDNPEVAPDMPDYMNEVLG